MSRRVVVTGMSGITSLGSTWDEIYVNMMAGKTGIAKMPDWDKIEGLNTKLGGPIIDFKVPDHYTRKQMRGMGRVSKLSVSATEQAFINANLLDQPDVLKRGRAGVAYGSCSGSTDAMAELTHLFYQSSAFKLNATTYVRAMGHTAAVNIAIFFGLTGRLIPTSSACTSSSQAIGYAYEAIKHGYQDVMAAGGGEELCPSQASVFDTLYATSQKNDSPELTPRPFDEARDGLVIGEGACTLILEEYEHAKSRGATIFAEVAGFATNCDAQHLTQPSADSMAVVMALALKNANVDHSAIGYINAHGTATERGDMAESKAVEQVFGDKVPMSSLKGFFGHTLGACGSLESWLSINMMNRNTFIPTANLKVVDPACAPLDYIQHTPREIDCEYVMSNNFAFGGVNTSLIFKRW